MKVYGHQGQRAV